MMAKEIGFKGKIELDRNKGRKKGEPNNLEVGGDRIDNFTEEFQEVRR